MTDKPLISIITATYNRSNVLKYAIQTVVDQTYEHWELLIIGDCCTDDTEEVVRGFKNAKIRFINLEKNIGEQSGPNNYGMAHSKGAYLALLNHDDLWMPYHLEVLHNRLKETDCELVYSLFYPVPVDGKVKVIPLRKGDAHDLVYGSPASSWLFTRELFLKTGPWKYFREIFDIPSQDWLGRASRFGEFSVVNEVTVITIQSGARMNSYKNRDYLENELYYTRIKHSPDKLLKEIYFEQMTFLKNRDRKVFYHLMAFIRNIVVALITRLRFRPGALLFIIKTKKKGGYIDELRELRGLHKLQRNN